MDIRQTLENLNAQWASAVARGELEALEALCTEDALLAIPGLPVARGRQEVVELCRKLGALQPGKETQETLDVEVSGNFAATASCGVR